MDTPIEILLVEDNPFDAELAIRALNNRNLANHLVHVKDGQEALDFLLGTGEYEGRNITRQPKVILLDLKLPKLDGLEVLRQLRAHDCLKLLPVVMLTSSHERSDVMTAYQLGVNSYIVKPVDFEKFLEVISNLGQFWLLNNEAPVASENR